MDDTGVHGPASLRDVARERIIDFQSRHAAIAIAERSDASLTEQLVGSLADDRLRRIATARVLRSLVGQLSDHDTGVVREPSDLTPRERLWHETLACVLVRHVLDLYRGVEPPTQAEYIRAEQSFLIQHARREARDAAARFGHDLDVWRPDVEGTEMARCQHCANAATLYLDSARVTLSWGLETSCPSKAV